MAQEIEDLYRERNWELATEISLYLIEHPELDVPQDALIVPQVLGERRFKRLGQTYCPQGSRDRTTSRLFLRGSDGARSLTHFASTDQSSLENQDDLLRGWNEFFGG